MFHPIKNYKKWGEAANCDPLWEEKSIIETDLETTELIEASGKGFKAIITHMFKDLKESIL